MTFENPLTLLRRWLWMKRQTPAQQALFKRFPPFMQMVLKSDEGEIVEVWLYGSTRDAKNLLVSRIEPIDQIAYALGRATSFEIPIAALTEMQAKDLN